MAMTMSMPSRVMFSTLDELCGLAITATINPNARVRKASGAKGIHWSRRGGVRSRCCRLMLKVGTEVGRTARHTLQPARAKPHQNASGWAHSKRRSATPQIPRSSPQTAA